MEIDAFRFWIGSENRRFSSIWKIWEQRRQVYATAASFGGSIKLSLHTPDDNQFGFTSEYRKKLNMPAQMGEFPTFVRWKRKIPSEREIIPIAFIQFPTDLLFGRRDVPAIKKRKFQGFLEPAPPGKCVELAFFSIKDPKVPEPLKMKGPYKSILQMPFGDDQLCLVGGRQTDFEKNFFQPPKDIRSPTEWMPESFRQLPPGDSLRDMNLTVWSHPHDFEAIRIAEISGVDVTKNS